MGSDHQLVTIPPARRAIKKLSKPIRKHILDTIQVLVSNPHHGKQLDGQWRFLRSCHTVYRRTHYRVVYEVDEKAKQVILRYADTRENFYKELRHMKLKPLVQ